MPHPMQKQSDASHKAKVKEMAAKGDGLSQVQKAQNLANSKGVNGKTTAEYRDTIKKGESP